MYDSKTILQEPWLEKSYKQVIVIPLEKGPAILTLLCHPSVFPSALKAGRKYVFLLQQLLSAKAQVTLLLETITVHVE